MISYIMFALSQKTISLMFSILLKMTHKSKWKYLLIHHTWQWMKLITLFRNMKIDYQFWALTFRVLAVNEKDFYFNAICLQEIWLSDSRDLSPFSIPGYQLINCPSSCSIHSALIMYLSDEFSYDIKSIQRDSELLDGLFVDIHGGNLNGKLTIGKIHRHPRNNCSNVSKYFLMN